MNQEYLTRDSDPAARLSGRRFYFGNSLDAAALDVGSTFGGNYSRGAIRNPSLPLAFGNFGSGFHANDRMFRGGIYSPQVVLPPPPPPLPPLLLVVLTLLMVQVLVVLETTAIIRFLQALIVLQ
jgi:hypothetical protein